MDHRLYLETKVEGDNRIVGKREATEGVYVADPQGPRATVKATLPEPQSSAINRLSPDYHAYRRTVVIEISCQWVYQTSSRQAAPNEGAQDDEQGTYSTLPRPMCEEHGIAYRGRPLWQRNPRSSLRAGEPSTRRRGIGDSTKRKVRYA